MDECEAELRRLEALVASPAACVAALANGQLPATLIRQLEDALASPLATPARLERIIGVLLQVIELEQQYRDDRVVQAAVAWATDTLLDLGHAFPVDEDRQESIALKRLQAQSLTTSSVDLGMSCDPISQLLPLLGGEDRLDAMEPEAAAEVLDLCATTISSDDEFLDATENLLGRLDCVPLGHAFTRRMLNPPSRTNTLHNIKSDAALLDFLPFSIKILVWGNHLPSWTQQLEQWLLAAHREPFKSIGSILAFSSPGRQKRSPAQTIGVNDWVKAFQHFSHLYIALIGWLQDNFEVLGSCRSVELVGTLAVLTRPPNSVGMFDRSLVNNLWTTNPSFWTPKVRMQRFVAIGKNVERLARAEHSHEAAISEWVGVIERPHLILEAMEMLFDSHQVREKDSFLSISEATSENCVSGAVRLLGWFHANIASFPPSEEIAAIAQSLRSNLAGVDLEAGARWLQLNRADFASIPAFRLRLVWFWLLQRVHDIDFQLNGHADDIEHSSNSAAITNILESIEYVFRRFTPSERKRPYQVEVVAQLLVDFEWRCRAYWSTQPQATRSTMTAYVDRLSAIVEWLTKIVRIMEVEEAKARETSLHDVQDLADRLRQLFAV